MAFRWRWLWLLILIGLAGERCFAAGAREDRAYAAAVGAFQDGLWSRAESGFEKFVQKYPTSARVPEAVLLQAEAGFQQGKLTNAIALLASRRAGAGALADQYAYWIGEAQFQNGDIAAAADTFVSLTRNFPESPLRLRAAVKAAAARARLEEWAQLCAFLESTNSAFQRAVQEDPTNELVVRGNLLLAQGKFAQKDFTGALAALELPDQQTLPTDLDWQRVYLLYQVKLAAGDTNGALAATTNLVRIAQAGHNDAWQAESLALRARVLEQLGQKAEAQATYQDIIALNPSVDRLRLAVLKTAELAMARNQFSNATLSLEKYFAQFPESPAADVVLLTLGELHLKRYTARPEATNQLSAAQACFDQFLRRFANRPLAGKAQLDYGWCLWLDGKVPESLAAFRTATEKLSMSEDLAVARFKLGDAFFAEKDFTNALNNYRQVVQDFTNFPAVTETLGDRALYQMVRANLELTNMDGANSAMEQLLRSHPASNLADSSLLLVGEGLADARQPAAARAIFRKFEEVLPNSPLRPDAELAIARTYEQDLEPDWPSAIQQYENWLKEYPTNALRARVNYALASAYFQAGGETNAFLLFTNFVAQFPTNDLAPVAQWWVADHYFNLGGTNYIDAERNYKILYQNTNWQGMPMVYTNLAYQARLMAGRSAVGLSSYKDAIDQFSSLASDTNCLTTAPDLAAQAMLEYGRVLMQMDSPDTNHLLANFQLATNVFYQICQLYPTNEPAMLAWNEIGDCDLQLANYDEATNAYSRVFNSPYANLSTRCRAQIGFGLALEKKATLVTGDDQKRLQQLALNRYLDVLDTSVGTNLRGSEMADPFWLKKAGLQALPLMEALGVADPNTLNAFFDRLEGLLPQLKDSLEKKRTAMLSAKS